VAEELSAKYADKKAAENQVGSEQNLNLTIVWTIELVV
jgi:hypothetical protein